MFFIRSFIIRDKGRLMEIRRNDVLLARGACLFSAYFEKMTFESR